MSEQGQRENAVYTWENCPLPISRPTLNWDNDSVSPRKASSLFSLATVTSQGRPLKSDVFSMIAHEISRNTTSLSTTSCGCLVGKENNANDKWRGTKAKMVTDVNLDWNFLANVSRSLPLMTPFAVVTSQNWQLDKSQVRKYAPKVSPRLQRNEKKCIVTSYTGAKLPSIVCLKMSCWVFF